MTGAELKKMMKIAGVTSPELAALIGWKTPFRIYEARQNERAAVRVVIDRALEKVMSPKRFYRALDEIRALSNPKNTERVTYDKGVMLSAQEKKDLISIATRLNARIHVAKKKEGLSHRSGTEMAETFQNNDEFSDVVMADVS